MNEIKSEESLANRRISGIQNARVLLVDDNIDLLKLMSIRLRPMKFELRTATSAEEALSILAVWPADLVITDLQMPGMSGMELFEILQYNTPLLPVIILTAHGTIPDAVDATQLGVASYLSKPFDSDVLIEKVQEALESSGFNENRTVNTFEMIRDDSWRNHIVSKSQKMRSLLAQVEKLAARNSLILLEGELGSGKDEVALALHLCSSRSKMPFVQVYGTSFTDPKVGEKIFGIANGDNGKSNVTQGLLQKATGGTILVSDYIEAPTKHIQPVLFALIDKTASPINSNHSYSVDVRIIITSTTNFMHGDESHVLKNLSHKMDLTRLEVPPLRERKEDIPGIVALCLKEFQPNKNMRLSPAAMQILLSAKWPGNVNQLTNLVKKCSQLSTTAIISDALVNSCISSPIYRIDPLTNAHNSFERKYLTEILRVTNGNVTQAANIAKRNRTEFHRLLKKHQIEAKAYRQKSNE